jgi:hypothetical protein
MLALGLFSLAAVANQVVIELFRRGQAIRPQDAGRPRDQGAGLNHADCSLALIGSQKPSGTG